MRKWLLLLMLLSLPLVLAACNGGAEEPAEGASAGDVTADDTGGAGATAEPTEEPVGDVGAAGDEQPAGDAAGGGTNDEPVRNNPAPAGDDLGAGCERLAVDDHRYTVADAGEVELRGDRRPLQIVDVRPASGWQHEVDKADDDDIRITFSSDGGDEYAFEADFTHGGLMVTVCPG